ncbi:MAG: MBL fold metallo-hydrolase [Rhizobiaceae bacterium]
MPKLFAFLLFTSVCVVWFAAAHAQESGTRLPSTCMAVADSGPTIIQANARVRFAQSLQPTQAHIKYVGHSSFLIEDPKGLKIVTDYSGFAGPDVIPDVVTMNHAHSTHFTIAPDPRIPHVLRGWRSDGSPARHFLQIGETLIRNVTTDINNQFAGYEPDGNSIFIFEMAGLCIGHLGHLHHLPTEGHYAQIGRLDILMVPVDGGYTMSVQDMSKVVRRLRASMILPMHWFGAYSLERFLAEIRGGFPVEMRTTSSLEVSLNTLPVQPTVIVLQPASSFGYFDAD